MRRVLLANAFAIALVGLPSLAGCLGAAAVAGAGYLVSREVGPDQRPTAEVAVEIEAVWFAAEGLLLERAKDEVGRYEKPRRLVARFDGVVYEVTIEWTGPEATRIAVMAQRGFAKDDVDAASRLLDDLVESFDPQQR